MDSEDPKESKTKDLIKFYFKDLKGEAKTCEHLEVDKNQYNMAFIANDEFPTDSIIVVLTKSTGEKKTPRLFKLKFNEDENSWEIAGNNGELTSFTQKEMVENCFVLKDESILVVLTMRLVLYTKDLE